VPGAAARNPPVEAIPSIASIPLETILPNTASQSRWRPEDGVRYEDRLVSRQALARWFDISPYRLAIWAREGYGPKALRLGRYKIAYRVGDCLAFINNRSADEWPDVRRKGQKTKTSPSQAEREKVDEGNFMSLRSEREEHASTPAAKEGSNRGTETSG
jgi:hypothetical protein